MEFRPHCFCPSKNAIDGIVTGAEGRDFAIEGDITGAFDNINHSILMKILKTKIKDKCFLHQISSGFLAAIMDNGVEKNTIRGVTQSSIVSPIIFNIYIHEFDKIIVDKLIPEYIPSAT